MRVTCFHTPCHTRGHMLFLFEPVEGVQEELEFTDEMLENTNYEVKRNVNRMVFTGDTIFTGGCGRFFEGQPHQMVAAMDLANTQMPRNTKMFPGHEYSVANLNFCALVDTNNDVVKRKKAEVTALR